MNRTENLNEFQRRRVSITVRILEEELHEIEEWIQGEGYSGALFEIKNDLPLSVREAFLLKISLAKERIKTIAEHFDLERRTESMSRRIFGILSMEGVSMEEIKAKQLRGYGGVADELYGTLDPELDSLRELLQEMLAFLTSLEKKY